MPWKIPDSFGFSALINSIKQIRRTSDAAASDVSGLQGDIQDLATQTATTFGQVDSALGELESGKLDKTNEATASIPVSNWKTDSSVAAYPKYYELTVTGVTAKDRADLIIAPASVPAAVACGLCPTCETLAGKIRVRAAQVPTTAISVRYWIEKGKV